MEDFLYNMEYFDSVRYAYIHNSESGVYQYKICDTGITLNLKNNMAELERIDRLRYEETGNFFLTGTHAYNNLSSSGN